MSNMQKAFKIKAKRGLCMAQGGFLSTVPDAMPTSMFAGQGGGVASTYSGASSPLLPNQRMAPSGSNGGGLRQAQGTQPGDQGTSSTMMKQLDGGIAKSNAIENSNLTMSEKSALGIGTTSADASALRRQTSAMSTLRNALGAQNMADGGVVAAQAQADRMCKTYGVGCDTKPSAPAPAPAAPAPAPAQPQGGGIVQTIRNRNEELRKATNYARGGVVQGMADGGVVAAQTQADRMCKEYGVGCGTKPSTPAPAPAPAPAPTPAPAPAPSQKSVVDTIRSYNKKLEEAANYKRGGVVQDGAPSEELADDVPVNLTRGEAVLPPKTVSALGGPEAVEELIERTNGKPPVKTGLRAGGNYADGVVQDGVRTGVRKGGRTNWVNPETRVVPYQPPVIESTATRMPNDPPEFIRQDAQPRALNRNSPLYASLRAQPKPPGTSVVPASPVNSNMNERVGNTGPAPQAEPYKPNWGAAKGSSVVPYSPSASDAATAARSANEVHQASVIKEAMRKNNLNPVTAAAEKAGEYIGPKVANTLRGAQNFARAAGPVLEAAVPAMAAYDAQFGDDAIVVNDWRGPMHSTGEKLKGGLKETALRAGDWGTKGLDALASPFTAITNVGSKLMGSDERVSYTKYNDIYRKGMQEGLDNVNAPTNGQATSGTRIVTDPAEIAKLKAMSTRHGGNSKPAGSTNLLDTPQYNSSSPEAVAAAKAAQLDPGFTPDAVQPGLRSGQMRFGPQAETIAGTSRVDATQMKAPEGGGYLTGSPDAKGLRRAIALPSQAPTPRDPNGEYDVDGNNMARTNAMKTTLREMQRDRIKRTAQMPGATQGDLIALADQQKDDVLQNDKLKMLNDNQFRREDLGLRRDQNRIAAENMAADNRRAERGQQMLGAEQKATRARNLQNDVGEQIKIAATGSDGKVDGVRQAMLHRAAAQITDPDNTYSAEELAQKKIGHAKAVSWLNDQGILPHWLKGEKEQDGYTMPDWRDEGDQFTDLITKQSISKWSLNRAPQDIQDAFHNMVAMRKDAREKALKNSK